MVVNTDIINFKKLLYFIIVVVKCVLNMANIYTSIVEMKFRRKIVANK